MIDLTGVTWRTSSYSNVNGECVEVADLPDTVLVRDTKDRSRPPFHCTAAAWRAFIRGVKLGEFDSRKTSRRLPASVGPLAVPTT